jgi:pyrimidine oxygenase
VDLGIFLPISNNGWIVSTTSPQYKPSFELNKTVTLKAEALGFNFVFSMARWFGYGGATEHWDHNLESISLMAGLAGVTETIDLYATVHPTAINPAVAAKMIATLDDISGGRAGLNIATGWDKVELASFGVWPGDEYYDRRYDYAEEWLSVARALWKDGRCTFDGEFLQMKDVLSLPKPGREIPVINAGMSSRGLEFSAKCADTSFVMVRDEEDARTLSARIREQAKASGSTSPVKMAAVFTVVAAETDEEAHAIVEHIRAGADAEAIGEMVARGSGTGAAPAATLENVRQRAFQLTLLVGSPTTVAQQMRRLEAAGVDTFLLTFPDFVADLDFFGREVLPLIEQDERLEQREPLTPSAPAASES